MNMVSGRVRASLTTVGDFFQLTISAESLLAVQARAFHARPPGMKAHSKENGANAGLGLSRLHALCTHSKASTESI